MYLLLSIKVSIKRIYHFLLYNSLLKQYIFCNTNIIDLIAVYFKA